MSVVEVRPGALAQPDERRGASHRHPVRWAFAGYLAISVACFGFPALLDPLHRTIGWRGSPDPRFFLWALAWWPHAIAHGMDPIWTRVVWAPEGFNLAWATSIPGPSLVLAPITLTMGAIASYNLAALLAPALSATTMFALCRHVTRSMAASAVGGFLFGFSTYQLGHEGIHVNLELTFLVPLLVLLVLRRLDGSMTVPRFIALTAAALIGQFSTSTEVFATSVAFGAVALVVAMALTEADCRRRLAGVAGLVGMALAFSLVVVSPFLLVALGRGVPSRRLSGSDLLSFVVPRLRTRLGSRLAAPLAARFPGTADENTTYLGVPLVAILAHFIVTTWRRPATKVVTLLGGIIALCSLGPFLSMAGRRSIPLPWRAVDALPLASDAAPRRFSMYLFLLAGLGVAAWLAARHRSKLRWAAVGVAVVSLLPAFSPHYLAGTSPIPRFFVLGDDVRYVARGDTVLLLPGRDPTPYPSSLSMAIQAATGFRFRLAVAYTGPTPRGMADSPLVEALLRGLLPPGFGAPLRRFLMVTDTREVILGRDSPIVGRMTAALGVRPITVDDVVVYRIRHPATGPSQQVASGAAAP